MRKLLVLFCLLPVCCFAQKKKPAVKYGTVKIVFTNLINNNPVVLHDSMYTNTWGEKYTLSKLKYYISNVSLLQEVKNQNPIAIGSKIKSQKSKRDYYLINQADTASASFSFNVPVNEYEGIIFLPGVDSIRNCSGAQTGALDPLNDMFWTWNTGYVMEKIEGTSPQSNIINNKVEYHIGGFKGEHSVLQYITLVFPKDKVLQIRRGKTSIIQIDAGLDKLWQGNIDLRISDIPSCSSPGQLAKQIAANFGGIFSISTIINRD